MLLAKQAAAAKRKVKRRGRRERNRDTERLRAEERQEEREVAEKEQRQAAGSETGTPATGEKAQYVWRREELQQLAGNAAASGKHGGKRACERETTLLVGRR
jgi:hypothetical protein